MKTFKGSIINKFVPINLKMHVSVIPGIKIELEDMRLNVETNEFDDNIT